MHLKVIHSTLCHPELVKGYLINPFIAGAPDDHSFNPLPTKNILKVFKFTHVWPMHLKINHLTFCNPGSIKGYLNNPFMVRGPKDIH